LPTLQVVWAVLTDYNQLAEFIPNLAVSQRIALPSSAPPNIIRIRQVGYKRMLYMCLHAESVLDLIEKQQRWVACQGRGGGLGIDPRLRHCQTSQLPACCSAAPADGHGCNASP
jgi:hypothetical protein